MVGLALNSHALDQVTTNVVVPGRGFIFGIVQTVPLRDVAIESDSEGFLPIHRVKCANEFTGFVKNPEGDLA